MIFADGLLIVAMYSHSNENRIRCEDLIVTGRRDIIRQELKEIIADRHARGY